MSILETKFRQLVKDLITAKRIRGNRIMQPRPYSSLDVDVSSKPKPAETSADQGNILERSEEIGMVVETPALPDGEGDPIISGSEAELKRNTGLSPSEEILSESDEDEPQFEFGVPAPGRWTCIICQENFPMFEVSVGHHVFHCIKTKEGVGLSDDAVKEARSVSPRPIASPIKSNPKRRRRRSMIPRRLQPSRTFKCVHCREPFPSRSALIQHAIIRHPNLNLYPRVPCPNCKNDFRDESALRSHLPRCKGETVKTKPLEVVVEFPCSKCSLKFPGKTELRNHLETHNDSKQCPKCCAEFTSKTALAEHQKTHPPDLDSFQCAVCKKVLSSKGVLQHHLGVCINNIKFASSGENKCNVCDKTFSSKYILRYHYKRHFPHHGDSVPKCTKCGRVFYSKSSLLFHVANVCGQSNGKAKMTQVKARSGTCKICNKKVPNFKSHMQIHARASGNHFCPKCPAKYSRPESLRKHIKKLHLSPPSASVGIMPPLVSPTSGAGTPLKPKGSPKRSCSSPAKKNSVPNNRVENEGVAVQIFKCGKCPKEFPTDRQRKAHEFIHTLQKTFKCPHCEREFSQKCNMTRHIATVHV